MNWNEIKEKYPKCYGLLLNFLKGFEITAINEWQFYPITKMRFLYDFFDGQGIWVHISPPTGFDEDINFYDADVCTPNDNFLMEETFKTRTEAEEQAFLKAFEILEDRI